MKLSVILPGIRPQNWQKLYDSIDKAINGRYSWELVAIGPKSTKLTHSYKFIEDYGSPCHCQQRALLNCEGEYITWAADDGGFLPDALNHDLNADAIFCKYLEGKPHLTDQRWLNVPRYKEILPYFFNEDMTTYKPEFIGAQELDPLMVDTLPYWTVNYHAAIRSQYIPDDWLLLCLGLIKRELLLELGGWDTKAFEICGMANPDLGNRIQRYGVKPVYWDHLVQINGNMPSTTGDHGPIHYGQILNDEPNYKIIYNVPKCVERIKIPIDDKDKSSSFWDRRFKA